MSNLRPVMSGSLLAIFATVTLCGCLEQVPPESAVPAITGTPPSAGLVSVTMDPEALAKALAERGPSDIEMGVLRVLDTASDRAASCYTKALERDPYLYGEVLLRLDLDAEGRVSQAASSMDTLGDQDLVGCVERLVQALHFPAPGGEGMSLRYPFLFTSDLTPPEVVRAMKANHGLLEDEAPGLDLETLDGADPSTGMYDTW